jgi:hypothetical protein
VEIQLTRGVVALIDDCDYDLVKSFRWCTLRCDTSSYAISFIWEDGVQRHLLMHRLILGVIDSRIQVDHIDGNGLNNVRSNLRLCSGAENSKNRKLNANSKTGVKGVFRSKDQRNTWTAQVRSDGVRHRKYFSSFDDAEQWVKEKRLELHREFSSDLSRV